MKKLNFVVPTLVLAVAMMGAGYASWSQTLSVTNTVATGTFNFVIQPATYTADKYETVTPSNTDNSLTVGITNAYPNSVTTVNDTIKNNSSIPATMILTPTTDGNFNGVIQVNGADYTAGSSVTLAAGQDAAIVYTLTANDAIPPSPVGGPANSYTCSIKADFAQATK